ncbi:E3 ubiquitin-protein ligase HOS1-like protein, partial [Drosera capensis]
MIDIPSSRFFNSVATFGKVERGSSELEMVPCDAGSGANASRFRSSFAAPLPDYGNKAVQDVLRHLASTDLVELCNEAKVEHCRAIRDLRSCGRPVESVLQSCGHPSLCEECSQRCDYCPICRSPLPKNGNKLRLRLYYECIKAGLISRTPEERMHDEENDETHITDDVLRLYSLFDVSMENNLSNKCKVTEMKRMVNSLAKLCAKLAGLSDILDILESSFKGDHSAKLDDPHHLLEEILKTKQ